MENPPGPLALRGRWRTETKGTRGERTGQGWEAGIPADEGTGDGHSLPLDTRFLAGSSGQLAKGEDSVGKAEGDGTDNATGILGAAGVIRKLAEGAIHTILQIINEDIEQHRPRTNPWGTPLDTGLSRPGLLGLSLALGEENLPEQGNSQRHRVYLPTGLTGSSCECFYPMMACQNGGTAIGCICFCPPGYSGERCISSTWPLTIPSTTSLPQFPARMAAHTIGSSASAPLVSLAPCAPPMIPARHARMAALPLVPNAFVHLDSTATCVNPNTSRDCQNGGTPVGIECLCPPAHYGLWCELNDSSTSRSTTTRSPTTSAGTTPKHSVPSHHIPEYHHTTYHISKNHHDHHATYHYHHHPKYNYTGHL
ncbi:unnamed protein product [Eretmochelys imbricata]